MSRGQRVFAITSYSLAFAGLEVLLHRAKTDNPVFGFGFVNFLVAIIAFMAAFSAGALLLTKAGSVIRFTFLVVVLVANTWLVLQYWELSESDDAVRPTSAVERQHTRAEWLAIDDAAAVIMAIDGLAAVVNLLRDAGSAPSRLDA